MTCALWPVIWPADVDPAALPAAQVSDAVEGASNLLWALTGRVYGVCTAVEQYRVSTSTGCAMPTGPLATDVGGYRAQQLALAQRPVRSVQSVKVNGVVVTDWFRQGPVLVRRGGYWPAVADYDPPNIEVAYTYGAGFPGGAGVAVGELAAELLKAARGVDCRLPSNVTSVTRNGVTITRADAVTLADTGLMGLPITDMLIRALNPGRLRQPSRVYAVDGARRG